jgi:uncharacterized protein (DUF433 family)
VDRPEDLIRLLPTCLHWSPDGEVRVVGRRIGLFHVVKEHRHLGNSPETIAAEFDLPLAVVQGVLDFAENHPAEVDAYVAGYQSDLDRQFAANTVSEAAAKISRLVKERRGQIESAGDPACAF